jgi:regulator of RNase E activity RraA
VSAIRFMGRFAITELDRPIEVRGLAGMVAVAPGDLVLADRDGVIALPAALAEEVIASAEQAEAIEARVKAEVLRGVPRLEASRRHGKS